MLWKGIDMEREIDGQMLTIPKHVAIILDGNGRWAKRKHLPRNVGHARGSMAVEKIIEDAGKLDIKYLTVYAFSTENWKRPQEEVTALMKLLKKYLRDCIKRANKNNLKVKIIGEVEALDEECQALVEEMETVSKDNTGLVFTIALNYGGRDEITRAMKHIATDCKAGKVTEDQINEELIANYLDTKGMPDPDLLIRTSNEYRLSNFMLWQLAYTEFYFTEVLWPDFDREQLIEAIKYYNKRERRFGAI